MTIEEILALETEKKIDALKSGRQNQQPDIASARKALDIAEHPVNNLITRPKKAVKIEGDPVPDGEGGFKETTSTKYVEVARIALAIQKLIIKRAVAFLFGNSVAYNASPEGANQELIVKALRRILSDSKSNSRNREIARAVFGFKEAAELWYPVEKPNKVYGFESKFKLRCAIFSPAYGDLLYPFFDETGDMIAFSREFIRVEKDGKEITFFETYTDKEHWLWKQVEGTFHVVEGFPKDNPIGKIPIVYAHQEEFETQDVDALIERLETLLSNFADTNDYHASPKIAVKGTVKGFAQKGETGAILELEKDASAEYLSWNHAPESVRLEIETLLKLIYTITQTPDISFDSVKGLGSISGVALKLLFMDPHLKVQDKREIFDEYLQRRANVIKAFIGVFNVNLAGDCETLEIEPEITPYILTSEMDEVKFWLEANGGKPLVSHKQSVLAANLSNDPEKDWDEIQDREDKDLTFSIVEPTE